MIQNQAKGMIDTMCYSSSKRVFAPFEVKNKCNDYEKTFVLYKNEENDRFGGYTTIKWNDLTPELMQDNNAFLFSLSTMKVFPILFNTFAVLNISNCFPSFGRCDIKCCLPYKCLSCFPSNYGTSLNSLTQLSHKMEFDLHELEVYGVIPQKE